MSSVAKGQAQFFAANQHSDVLNASPDTPEGIAKLVDALKTRGNEAFKRRSLVEAEVLYSKAIEHDPKMVALYGNRSMARSGMGQFENALSDAEKAIEVDPSWVKGYYRKAVAQVGLKRFADAEKSWTKLLEMDPGNKAAKTELGKIPKLKEAHAKEKERLAKEAAEREKEMLENLPKDIPKAFLQNQQKAKAAKADAGTEKATTNGKDKDLSMRGYRTLADGRKTTYFNRELSEKEKEMLKDNKPKQVGLSKEELEKAEREKVATGQSVWNQGGTFEEKDMTSWGHDLLKKLLVGVSVSLPIVDQDGDELSEDLKVSELVIDGDCSITFTRGKKRHIFDFTLDAKWNLNCNGKTISGTLFFPDVSGDVVVDDDDLEYELRWTNRASAGKNEERIKKILTDKAGLYGELKAAIQKWAVEFRKLQ